MSEVELRPAVVGSSSLQHLELGRVLDDAECTRTAGAAALHRRGRRPVCTGHTISIAAAPAMRAVPALTTIVAWEGCECPSSAFEGDVLGAELLVRRTPDGLDRLPERVCAERPETGPSAVLDRTFVAVVA